MPLIASPPAEARDGLPQLVTPGVDLSGLEALIDNLRARADEVQTHLRHHGALLMRGFAVDTAADFERVARAIDDDLKNEYLGTSPRDAVTEYVFSASELPGFYPIPQHCEMTFTRTPPRRIFFWCDIEPARGSGETPLVDFRKVWRDLPDPVRDRFAQRGLRLIRNYAGPGTRKNDLWQLKRWDEMFQTTDRAEVERIAARERFEAVWKPGDRLALISTHDAMRPHPETGEPVWFNHAQVFHLSTGPAELKRIFRFRPSLRSLFWWLAAEVLTVRKRRVAPDDQAMHCTWRDGREIDRADLDAVRDAIWRNLVVVPWRKGDVVAIDNHAIGHGRLPYRGARRVSVCWA